MKSFFTFALAFFALVAVGQNQVCAVMSPISNQPGAPIGLLQLNTGTNSNPTLFSPPNATGCLNLAGLPLNAGDNLLPYKNINCLNGVSTFDLVKISKHILGIQPFTSCFHQIAADINGNGMISTFDLVQMRKVILGITPCFPGNTSWRFVPKNCTTPCFGSCPTCVFSTSTNADCEFFGIKIGDLTGDAIPNNFTGEIFADRSPALFSLENRQLAAGQTLEIPIFSENETALLAWQMALKFDPNFIEITESPDAPEAAPMLAVTAPGRAAMNWFSDAPRQFLGARDALISLKIKVLRDCKLADVLFLENENLAPEAYFEDEKSHPISLVFSDKKQIAAAQNLTAWPNPFSEKTTLEWPLLEAGEVSIDVFDATGRAVFSTKFLGEKGANRFALDGLSEGLFFVKMQAGREIFSTSIFKH